MKAIDLFNNFAEDFEQCVKDDNWNRLQKTLAKDANYLNVGGPDQKCTGRTQVINYLQQDVTNTDRRFDTRTLTALSQPEVDGNRLCRRWRITYTLADTPDLVIEGEARYLFEDNLIKQIEEQPTEESMLTVNDWMQKYADRLHPKAITQTITQAITIK